jgi:hypothetical protein
MSASFFAWMAIASLMVALGPPMESRPDRLERANLEP